MPNVPLNGITLRYEIDGNGPPVILVTGFGGDVSFWRRASEIMSLEYTVIRVDNRGMGETSYNGGFTLDNIAEDIICLMDELGLVKTNLIGWSMGSHIVQKIALLVPEKIGAMVLVSSYRYRPARSKYVLTSMLDLMNRGAPAECLARTLNCMCYTEEFFEEMEKNGKNIRSPNIKDPVGLRYQMDAVELSDMTDAAHTIAVPTLLVHGTKDIMVGCDEGLRLAESIPGCEKHLVDGAGHLIPADRYIPYVMKFIKDHL
jgi:pimeloyl-ACP methyl ester carboxylesterase